MNKRVYKRAYKGVWDVLMLESWIHSMNEHLHISISIVEQFTSMVGCPYLM